MKTLLVERSIECPNCGRQLMKGDIMYDDECRDNVVCCYCLDQYKDLIESEETFINN